MIGRGSDAQEAGGTELFPKMVGKGVGFISFGGEGLGDLAADEFLDGGAEVGEV